MAREPTYGLRRYWHMRYTIGKGQDRRILTSSVTHTLYLHHHPYDNNDASRRLTTFITFGVHMLENRLQFVRQYMKIFGWPNSFREAVLITDELHDKLISFASHVYDPYSIQIDSKPSVNTQIS